MIFKKFTSGMLGVNSYFLINENTRECVLIDGGEDYDFIKNKEKELGVKIIALLLTHAHFDHSGNARKLQMSGVKVYASGIEAPKLLKSDPLCVRFGRNRDTLTVDGTFENGETLNFAGIEIAVVLTPGHTDGSVTFVTGNKMITGDTLFRESIGRTDFETGNFYEIEKSIKKLYAYEGDYEVYPGHGENTTLKHERENNLYVRI